MDIPVKMKPSQCVLCLTTEHDGTPCRQDLYGHHRWNSWAGTVDKDALIADLKAALAEMEAELCRALTRAEMAEMWRRRWKTRAAIFAECNRIAREAYRKLLAADDKTVDELIESEKAASTLIEKIATWLDDQIRPFPQGGPFAMQRDVSKATIEAFKTAFGAKGEGDV